MNPSPVNQFGNQYGGANAYGANAYGAGPGRAEPSDPSPLDAIRAQTSKIEDLLDGLSEPVKP